MKIDRIDFPLKDLFIRVFADKVFLVGGTIRDYLLYGRIGVSRDIDLVVTDHSYKEIEKKLRPYGKTNTVGRSFAVVKFSKDGDNFDISVPRKDTRRDKESHSHRNFIIESGPHISLEDDLARRDFTCNSIAMRLYDNQMVDPFDGVTAIEKRRITMTGPETFFDDPLRILRAARFASVHQFAVDESIYGHSREVRLDGLSAERVLDELFRLLLESEKPSLGLHEYFKLSALERLFPELTALALTIQDAHFHPETDEFGHHTVWAHTLITVDIARDLCRRYALSEEQTLALLLAALLHDVGKAVTTRWEFKRGRMTVTSMYHDSRGVDIAGHILARLKIEGRHRFPLKKTVLSLVKYHHRIYDLYRHRVNVGFKAVSRLVRDLENQDFLLLLLDFADRRSRCPDPLAFTGLDEASQWLLEQKEALDINQESIKPLVMGRDLVNLGISPGKDMGDYLQKLYELQLDGAFQTVAEGLEIFKKLHSGQD